MSSDQDSRTRLTLLSRLRQEQNDQAAWTEFLARYEPQLLSWCRSFGLQDADAHDVTQDVLLRLAQKMKSFQYDPSKSFRAWLKTLTRHAWKDFLADRMRQASGDGMMDKLLADVQAPETLVACLKAQFDLEILEEAQSRVQWRVDVQSWQAFRLTAVEDISGAETAERLGMTVAAVYKAKSRVLKMLQEEVQRMEEIA
jgi:RNA polymerase sigma factor (sigma-70 family)